MFSTLHLKPPQENYMEAFSLLERALAIRTKKLGENHPDTISTQNDLEAVRQKVRAQLGRRVGKASCTTHCAKSRHCSKLFCPVAGVKTRLKHLPATAVGHRKRVNKTGAALENYVECDGTPHI